MTGNDCRVNQTEEHVFKKPFSHVTVNFHQTQALASHLACNEPCHAGFFLVCLLYVYFHHAHDHLLRNQVCAIQPPVSIPEHL